IVHGTTILTVRIESSGTLGERATDRPIVLADEATQSQDRDYRNHDQQDQHHGIAHGDPPGNRPSHHWLAPSAYAASSAAESRTCSPSEVVPSRKRRSEARPSEGIWMSSSVRRGPSTRLTSNPSERCPVPTTTTHERSSRPAMDSPWLRFRSITRSINPCQEVIPIREPVAPGSIPIEPGRKTPATSVIAIPYRSRPMAN